MFGGSKTKEGAKETPSSKTDTKVGPLKDASDELKVSKDFKVYTDAKSSELVEVLNVATNKRVQIARVHVQRLVKAGLVKEV